MTPYNAEYYYFLYLAIITRYQEVFRHRPKSMKLKTRILTYSVLSAPRCILASSCKVRCLPENRDIIQKYAENRTRFFLVNGSPSRSEANSDSTTS